MALPWGGTSLAMWRLDVKPRAGEWDSGIGASKVGGRWNPKGFPVVYCAADPATAILEIAVHKGFHALDTIPHVLTKATIVDAKDVHVVDAADVPNAAWLKPGYVSKGQQDFGKDLLEAFAFILIPSAVCNESWNVVFTPAKAAGKYKLEWQKPFELDTRLNPA